MKITGTYKKIRKSLHVDTKDLVIQNGGCSDETCMIDILKKIVAVMIFGEKKTIPFYKYAHDRIHLIKWEITK